MPVIPAHLRALPLAAVLALCAPAAAAGAPRAVITVGPEAQTTATDATLAFSATGRGLLPWSFDCRFDGGAWARCASPVTLTGLVAGPHGFEVRLIGLFADTTPATRAWTVIRDTVVTPPPLPVAPGGPPAGPTGCAGAGASPRSASRERLERATLCLLNEQRTRRGLAPVRRSARLSGAARRHATAMVRRQVRQPHLAVGDDDRRPDPGVGLLEPTAVGGRRGDRVVGPRHPRPPGARTHGQPSAPPRDPDADLPRCGRRRCRRLASARSPAAATRWSPSATSAAAAQPARAPAGDGRQGVTLSCGANAMTLVLGA